MTVELTRHGAAASLPASLSASCGARVHLPGDPAYDVARRAWDPAVDQRPAAVALPRTAADVAEVVRAARAAGLRVAPQGTGHGAGPLAARGLEDVVLLRTSALAGVTPDPARAVVRVGAGATWGPVVDAATSLHGAVLHGSGADLGVAGFCLGGGLGPLGRRFGLACDSVTAVELVLADGSAVRVDAEHEPDLFWAVRGGGGSFGVATALELRVHPVATAYAGCLMWDLADADRVVRAWAAWAPEAPDEVTTTLRVTDLPERSGGPRLLRGQRVLLVEAAAVASDERAEDLLAGLRSLRPDADTVRRSPVRGLVRRPLAGGRSVPAAAGTTLLHSFPDAAVDAFLGALGTARDGRTDGRTALRSVELRQLGGALGRPHAGAGALPHLDGQVLLHATGDGPGAATDVAALRTALEPWDSGRAYLNLTGTPVPTRAAYGVDRWRRLTALRRAVDPDGVLVANHPVPHDLPG